MRPFLLIGCLMIVVMSGVGAQTSAAPSATARATSAPQETATEEDAGPVPVPEPSDKAMSYYRSGNILWVVNMLWGILIPAAFVFTGFSARLRDWARTIGRQWFFITVAYFFLYYVIRFAIDFPLDFYQGFVRQHDYGLSNQTFGKWFADALKSLMVWTGIWAGVLWIPYLLIEKSPRRWWLDTGLLAIPFLFVGLLISPIWIDPLFNDYGPMEDKALEAKILALADRAGIEGSRVYEVDKSLDTNAINAYVTGFMNTKRIVLWDTIIAKLDEDELLFVMGHEMGHYVLNHLVKGVLFVSGLVVVILYLVHRTAGGLIDRFKGRFGFDHLADVASFPLIILLVNLFLLVIIPIGFTYSRYLEREADRFGLEITRDNRAAAMAFVKLQTENLSNPRPGPFYTLWRATHPTLGERIDFCNRYRPWEKDEPLQYGHLFENGGGR